LIPRLRTRHLRITSPLVEEGVAVAAAVTRRETAEKSRHDACDGTVSSTMPFRGQAIRKIIGGMTRRGDRVRVAGRRRRRRHLDRPFANRSGLAVAVVSAGAALLGALVGFIGSQLATHAQLEHEKALTLRDERRAACVEFLATLDQFHDRARSARDAFVAGDRDEFLRAADALDSMSVEIDRTGATMAIIATDQVAAAGGAYLDTAASVKPQVERLANDLRNPPVVVDPDTGRVEPASPGTLAEGINTALEVLGGQRRGRMIDACRSELTLP
jgi:hypothetical protein